MNKVIEYLYFYGDKVSVFEKEAILKQIEGQGRTSMLYNFDDVEWFYIQMKHCASFSKIMITIWHFIETSFIFSLSYILLNTILPISAKLF